MNKSIQINEIKKLISLIKDSIDNVEEMTYTTLSTHKIIYYYILNEIDFKTIKDCIDEIEAYIYET